MHYSGADIENLCREATLKALRETIVAGRVYMRHFEAALKLSSPSITHDQLAFHESMQQHFGRLS